MTGRAPDAALLTAADFEQLGDLMFVARKLVEGLYAGRHRSPRRGHSTEFYDYRAYVPGDELRRVDWKVFGRSDRLYVRRYRHDAQLDIHLLVDRSASMDFAGLGRDGQPMTGAKAISKWRLARQLAAALAVLAVRQTDRVGLIAFDRMAQPILPSGGTWSHLKQLVGALETMAPVRGPGDPETALRAAHAAIAAHHSRRGMVVLISDLLDDPAAWLRGLHPFLHDRFDIVVLQTLTPQEMDLRGIGSLRLVDLETADAVRTHGPSVRQTYREAMNRHIHLLHSGLSSRGVDCQLMRTDRSPIESLRGFVAGRAAGARVV